MSYVSNSAHFPLGSPYILKLMLCYTLIIYAYAFPLFNAFDLVWLLVCDNKMKRVSKFEMLVSTMSKL